MARLQVLINSLRFAEVTKNKELERQIHNQFGVYYHSIGKYEKAIESFEVYLTIAKENGDRKDEVQVFSKLATCYISLGQHKKSIRYQEMGLTIAKEIGHKEGEMVAYCNLATCYIPLGQYNESIKYQEMGLTIAKEIGHKEGEMVAYCNLVTCYISLGQYNESIKYQEMGLTIAKEIGHMTYEAAAYCNLANCYMSLGQYNESMKYQEMGLNIAKEIGDKKGEGTAYGNLGNYYIFLCQYDKAINYLEMRLTIAKDIGDKKGEGAGYCNLGVCYMSLDQYNKSIKYHEMSLNIAKRTGDKNAEGTAYGNLGTCYSYLSQYDKAIKYQEMRLTIAKEIRDKKGEGVAYGNLGVCHKNLSQYKKAIMYLEMLLTIAKEIGDKKVEGITYGNLAACYINLGQYEKAIKYQEMSLTIAKKIGNRKSEGSNYCNLGTSYSFLGQSDKAIEYYQMGLTIAKEIGDKKVERTTYGNLGDHYMSLRQYDKAMKYEDMGLNIAKEIGDKKGEGTAYGDLGICYSFLGQYEKAIKYQEMRLTIAKEIRDKKGEGSAYGDLGTCYSFLGYAMKCQKMFGFLGQYEKAANNLRKAVECFEELFENVPTWDEDKVSVIDTFIYIYQKLMRILLAQKKNGEALIIAERGRSRALADLMLTTQYPVQYSFTTVAKISDLHDIRKLVKTLGSTVIFFALLTPDIYTWVLQPNGDVMFQTHRTELPQQSIEHTKNALFHSTIECLNSLVNKATKLMTSREAVRCEDRSLSFLYSEEVSKPTEKKPRSLLLLDCAAIPNDLTVPPAVSQHRLAAVQEQKITRKTTSQDQETKDSTNPNEAKLNCLLKDLYQILLEPVRKYVVGSQLTIIPEGVLALVPFAALLDEHEHYVSESLQVRLFMSLKTAQMIRERPEEPAGNARLLVIGDPDVGEVKKGDKIITVPRLPSAKKEVKKVAQLLKVKPLVGKKATKETFLQNVESADLIHIAAHGDANKGEILFAPGSGTTRNNLEDVMLFISDLERKRIKAKLVVLSCCYSGRGEVRAEGVVGIARAFLGAGARAVLVTLWAVDDAATFGFTWCFYECLRRGDSVSEALHKAMKALRERVEFCHPRYWAPFVLLGEDVTPFRRS